MATTATSRPAVALAALCLTVSAGAASAAAAGPSPQRIQDVAGDANGLNDQGEGVLVGRQTGRQVDQADLRTIDLAHVAATAARTAVLRVSFTTTARPAPLADGTPLAYGVVLQPTPDCRMTVEHVTGGSSLVRGSSGATGLLTHTCDDGRHAEVAVRASLAGRTATVEVAHRLLPAQARAAKADLRATGYVRTVPLPGSAARPLELDSAR